MTHKLDWQAYQATPNYFKNKVYLLTGAADGIGRAITIALAEQGATVLMLDKKARHLEKLYDSVLERGFEEPIILPIDLMEITPESSTVLAQSINDDIGYLDGIIHNAAELGSPSPLDQYDMDYWNKVMHTNLQAPYFLTRALLPVLKREHTTRVLFCSADVGRQAQAYWGAYSIAYAGLEAQMNIWALEQEKISNIRFNSVDPGPVRTSLRRRSHPGESQDALMTPQQVAPAFLKLLEDESLHGEQITLQG